MFRSMFLIVKFLFFSVSSFDFLQEKFKAKS